MSREKYLGTTKASTRMISVHVQMYNIFRLLIGVPDYSISESYVEKQKMILVGFVIGVDCSSNQGKIRISGPCGIVIFVILASYTVKVFNTIPQFYFYASGSGCYLLAKISQKSRLFYTRVFELQ